MWGLEKKMYAKHLTLCQIYRWNLISGGVIFCFLCTRLRLWYPPSLFPSYICATSYICDKPDLSPRFIGLTTWTSLGFQVPALKMFLAPDYLYSRSELYLSLASASDLVSILVDALIANSLMPLRCWLLFRSDLLHMWELELPQNSVDNLGFHF